MKKIFTILGVSAAMFASAQTNLFAGSDFNDWPTLESSLGFSLKSGEQSVNGGVGGTGALKIIDNTTTQNIYVMTANKNMNTSGINYITVKFKGVSGGISFNAGDKFFNVPAGTSSNITLQSSATNSYTGSINAADWITVTLDVSDVSWTANSFSIKLQKSSTNALFVDDIKGSATLAVGNVNATKANLVKNTVVTNEIIFGETSKVSVINMNGQVVKTADATENSRLNVSELPKGMYLVSGTVNGKAVSQKIIKK
ncbi:MULTISPECIES: T9SS type A sorting domain-containing protein [unclassified Kaistella]|uniref:T9SS type A sorting domain-containing protein n=1 Tax=unclassified Kaistella TaxID=2762626 RepID=UPI002732DB39|nr:MULTISPECIES: T9SS type A sorting domain-containing protein [unclassified Kaistella]MDP2453551.1 T9SS type A sorting domain-containing protein [Kaistella sp. SH11-4b]MDP2456608.1 T9SS type A sorting domain-containing protein [Kaistella sp. SH40-3]MDP2459364.1 T9SS type A sorting domain-containing protein [Kaistella sp. SH19-2b]